MPTNFSQLSHSFSISQINRVYPIDCKLNIVKRIEEILYRSNFDSENVNIAFLSNDPVTSETNLSIVDRSTSLEANREFDTDPVSFVGSSFLIETENFLVTDVFTDPINSVGEIPLFYKHIIGKDILSRVDIDNEDWDLAATTKLISFSFLDYNLQPIKAKEFKLDSATGIIYINLLIEYKTHLDFTPYYIKYSVNISGAVKTFIELLDSIPTYRIADFDDLSPSMTLLQDGRKVYLIDEQTNDFLITLPISNTYAYKPLSSARIKIIPPSGSTTDDAWHIRVTNGKFFTSINGTLYKYHLEEFLTQTFFPWAPLKTITNEIALVLDNHLVKLDHENIFTSEDDLIFLNLLINDAEDNGLAAFTTDSSIVGNIATNGKPFVFWTEQNHQGIRSIDRLNGIIDIEGFELASDYLIYANYVFSETHYEFTQFNLNPFLNKEAIATKLILFVEPDTISSSLTANLHYLLVDKSGKVTTSDWDQWNQTSGVMLDGAPLYYETYPSFMPSGVHHIFTEEFTTESSVLSSLSSPFLILGDTSVSEAQHWTETSIFDTRIRGGGIIASEFETAIESQPEAVWYWDQGYWDGIPYPGNASFLIEVPADILDNATNGRFSYKEIRDVIGKHTAAGIYPVLRSYHSEITLSGIVLHWNMGV